MALRPEHLEGLMRRLAANERILRIMVVGQLVDLLYEHIDPDAATKIEEMYTSLSAGKGEYVFSDFREAVNEILAVETELSEDVQHQIKVCFGYLFLPPPPVQ